MSKFYVKRVTSKGDVIGYGIYDKVNGIVSEHEYFPIVSSLLKYKALDKAMDKCDEMNEVTASCA